MSVYNDMACDAGYRYGTGENQQLAAMIEADEYRKACERAAEEMDEQQTYFMGVNNG